jgi:hypothetical protein
MATADDIDAQIAEDATKAKSSTVGGETIQRRDLREQIEASKHIRTQQAMEDPEVWPFKTFKISPPGGR